MLRRICLTTTTALALACIPSFAAAEPVVADKPTTEETTQPAPAAPVVRQGDSVTVVGKGLCTIAFNDLKQGVSYTAGHCGAEGDRAVVASAQGNAAGTFHPSSALGEPSTSNDWAVIRWADGVQLKPNTLSGDSVAEPSLLRSGDPVCVYGAASKKTTCGSFVGAIGNNIYWDGPSGKPGDSGGPVWVEGQGLLSIYTGVSIATSAEVEKGRLNRSSVPKNGPQVTSEQELELLLQTKRITTPVTHETAVPGGEPTPVSEQGSSVGTGSSGSSEVDGGGIAVVALIVLAGVLLALPEIVKVLPAEYREQLALAG